MDKYDLLFSVPVGVVVDDPHREPMYHLDTVRALPGVTVIEPHKGCWLAVHTSPDELTVKFAGLEFCQSDDSDGLNTLARVIFQGHGTGGSLREMRHTYWGEDKGGYVFYLPIDGTVAMLTALKQYFDD